MMTRHRLRGGMALVLWLAAFLVISIPALADDGCTHEDVEIIPLKMATCTQPGSDEYARCTLCGEILGEPEIFTPIGHCWDAAFVIDEPTCIAEGTIRRTCTVCGDENYDTIPMTDHAWDDGIVTTPATEIAEGLIRYTCTVCSTTQTQSLPPLPHTHVDAPIPALAATCTQPGATAGIRCAQCEAILVAPQTIEPTGHRWDEGMVTTAATETADGVATYTCVTCGETKQAPISYQACPHHFVWVVEVEPGCDLEGVRVSICTLCGAVDHTEPLPAQHVLEWFEDPAATCIADGRRVQLCVHCGAQGLEEVTPKNQNHMPVWIDERVAICTQAGERRAICSWCLAVLDTAVIPPTPHTEVIEDAVPPTCMDTGLTEGKHCAVCHAQLVAQEILPISASAHVYGAWEVYQKATTSQPGVRGHDCQRCGKLEFEEIAPIGVHDHQAAILDAVAPTCTASGMTEGAYCSICDVILIAQETVEALGHEAIIDAAVTPTCTEPGSTQGTRCSLCDAVIVPPEPIAALGHQEATDPAIAPTCTQPGQTEGKHCAVCSAVLVTPEPIAALGHQEVSDPPVAPTCTESGQTEGTHCFVCNAVIVTPTPVAALGHRAVADPAIAPTCTQPGQTEGTHCSVCSAVIVAPQPVAVLGHRVAIDPAVAPTCTQPGRTESAYCSVCTAIIGAPQPVAALGHRAVTDPAIAPTCTQAGRTEGAHCSVCAAVLAPSQPVAASGHIAVTRPAIAPTCTQPGQTEGKYCFVCTVVLVASQPIAAWGHRAVTDPTIPPTCTQPGQTEGEHCAVCAAVLVAPNRIEALGHTEVLDEAVQSTCTNPGRTSGKHCSVCEMILESQDEIAATGHSVHEVGAKAATCTAAGCLAHWQCATCGAVFLDAQCQVEGKKDDVVLLIQAHNYGETIAKSPTCHSEGLAKFTCRDCARIDYQILDKVDHAPGAAPIEMIPATCTQTGEARYACVFCEATMQTVVLSQTPHSYEAHMTPATCTESAKEGYFCTICGRADDHHGVTVVGAPLGHDWDAGIAVAATCEESGRTVYACTRAGCAVVYAEVDERYPALGHQEVMEAAIPPTCMTTGQTAGVHCAHCGKTLVQTAPLPIDPNAHCDQERVMLARTCTTNGIGKRLCACGALDRYFVIPAGHCWDGGTPPVVPTCTTTGTRQFTCEACGESKTEEVATIEHHYTEQATREATCGRDGQRTFTCACGDGYTEILPATGDHHYEETSSEATCVAPTKTGFLCIDCGAEDPHRPAAWIGEALGHTWDSGVYDAPTCTAAGNWRVTCEVCGAVQNETTGETVEPPLGHTEMRVPAVSASCSQTGRTEGIMCAVCGTVLTPQTEVPVNPSVHTLRVIPMRAATCTANGIGKNVCVHCGYVEGYAVMPRGAHRWNEGIITVAPTCTTVGQRQQTCTLCGQTQAATLEALGHTYQWIVDEAPNCGTVGWRHEACATCQEAKAAEPIPATAEHVFAESTSEATCTEPARTGRMCLYCHAIQDAVAVGEALGHDWDEGAYVAPTCEAGGYTRYTCQRCAAYREATTGEPPQGHQAVIDPAVEATCTQAGRTEGSHCAICQKEIVAPIETALNPDQHTFAPKILKPATCAMNGIAKWVCPCGASNGYIVLRNSHSWNEGTVTQIATCGEPGEECFTCQTCGATRTEALPASGQHVYGEKQYDVTGERVTSFQTCTICGYTHVDH